MGRLSRVVILGYPHHITQRGVRSMALFDSDADRSLYLDLIAKHCSDHGVEVLTWCLMDNHVHFIAVPESEKSLAKAFGLAHKASWSRWKT